MRKILGSTGLIAIFGLLLTWLSIINGLWKSDAERFSESTCGPETYAIGFQECLEDNFGPGTSMTRFREYVVGSGFIGWARRRNGEEETLKFIMIRDNEKNRHRIAIFVTQSSNIISDIKSIQGTTVEGWQ